MAFMEQEPHHDAHTPCGVGVTLAKEGWWKFITYLCASMEDDDSYNILKPLMLAKSMVATSMSYHCPHSFAPSKIWCLH
jgi:hypothetical protein